MHIILRHIAKMHSYIYKYTCICTSFHGINITINLHNRECIHSWIRSCFSFLIHNGEPAEILYLWCQLCVYGCRWNYLLILVVKHLSLKGLWYTRILWVPAKEKWPFSLREFKLRVSCIPWKLLTFLYLFLIVEWPLPTPCRLYSHTWWSVRQMLEWCHW